MTLEVIEHSAMPASFTTYVAFAVAEQSIIPPRAAQVLRESSISFNAEVDEVHFRRTDSPRMLGSPMSAAIKTQDGKMASFDPGLSPNSRRRSSVYFHQDVHEVSYRQSMAASEVGDNSSFKSPLDLSLACDSPFGSPLPPPRCKELETDLRRRSMVHAAEAAKQQQREEERDFRRSMSADEWPSGPDDSIRPRRVSSAGGAEHPAQVRSPCLLRDWIPEIPPGVDLKLIAGATEQLCPSRDMIAVSRSTAKAEESARKDLLEEKAEVLGCMVHHIASRLLAHEVLVGKVRYLVRWEHDVDGNTISDSWVAESRLLTRHDGRVAICYYRESPDAASARLPPLDPRFSRHVQASRMDYETAMRKLGKKGRGGGGRWPV
jgi:hypothetical protein